MGQEGNTHLTKCLNENLDDEPEGKVILKFILKIRFEDLKWHLKKTALEGLTRTNRVQVLIS
jgi:hypothetical protein